MIKLAEEILGNNFVPEIGVIGRRVSGEMAEGSVHMSAVERDKWRVLLFIAERDSVEIDILRLLFVDVIGQGGKGILPRDPDAATEGGGAIHTLDQFRGNWFIGFVVARKRCEHLRAVHPFFQHLRGRFYEVAFHGDSADSSPLLLAS